MLAEQMFYVGGHMQEAGMPFVAKRPAADQCFAAAGAEQDEDTGMARQQLVAGNLAVAGIEVDGLAVGGFPVAAGLDLEILRVQIQQQPAEAAGIPDRQTDFSDASGGHGFLSPGVNGV